MKFKVGDIVTKVKESVNVGYGNLYKGGIDTITHINNGQDSGQLTLKNHGNGHSIENFAVRIKDTKIARKMNKNNIDNIEEGWIYLK